MKLLVPVLLVIMPALLLLGWESSPSEKFLERLEPSLPITSRPISVSSVSVESFKSPSAPSAKFFWMTTNRFALIPDLNGTNLVQSPLCGLPAPGVYKTEPFTCIVLVPGSNHDDRMVIGTANPDPKMSRSPDLRFVPLPRK